MWCFTFAFAHWAGKMMDVFKKLEIKCIDHPFDLVDLVLSIFLFLNHKRCLKGRTFFNYSGEIPAVEKYFNDYISENYFVRVKKTNLRNNVSCAEL